MALISFCGTPTGRSGRLGTILLLALALAACGSNGTDREQQAGAGGAGGSAPDGGGGEGGGGANLPIRDTSGYEGKLAWSVGLNFGVRVWDLASSKTAYVRISDSIEELYREPALSEDGSTLVFVQGRPYSIGAVFSVVQHVDLATGEQLSYPDTGLADGQIRNTVLPSASGDGSRVAVGASVSDDLGDGLYSNGTPLSIEVWDVRTGERIPVTSGNDRDTMPLLDHTGETVVFLSNRDGPLDIYRAPVETNAEATRLTAFAHESITELRDMEYPGKVALSSDGRWIAFLARTKEGTSGAFLLDTTNGSVSRFGPVDENVLAMDISSDGSRLAWSTLHVDEEKAEMYGQIYTSFREELASGENVFNTKQLPTALALSGDGSQLAFVDSLDELWVSRPDGSDPKQVSGGEEGDVIPMMGMSLTF